VLRDGKWWPKPTRTLRSAADDSWCHIFEGTDGYADVEVYDDGDVLAGRTPLVGEPAVLEVVTAIDRELVMAWIRETLPPDDVA